MSEQQRTTGMSIREETVARLIREVPGHVTGEGIRIDASDLERILGEAFDVGQREVTLARADEANLIGNLIAKAAPAGGGMRPDGSEDPGMSAYVEGLHVAHDIAKARYAEHVENKNPEG